MEPISTEDIITSLFALGYNQIDSIFVTMVIGKMTLDTDFKFEDKEFSDMFLTLVDYDGMIYKLKRGKTLDLNISPIEGETYTLRQLYSRNKELLEYLDKIDIQKIVDKKIKIVGYERLPDNLNIFSNKEKSYLPRIKKNRNYDDLKPRIK